MRQIHKWLLLLLLLLGASALYAQQPVTEQQSTLWDVYAEYNVDGQNTDRILFLDLLSGDVRSVTVTGERYTLLGDQILYYDRSLKAVMTIQPDGTLSAHPFVRLDEDARRADWVVSSDGRLIAWTLTYGTPDALRTVTRVASIDGSDLREVLTDGPRGDGARVMPVAIARNNTALILDSQPNAIGDLTPYRQYASLFSLSLTDGTITALPGEPDCFCAAAIRNDQFLRLSITADFSGFDVRVINLENGTSNRIPATGLVNYTQGGDILIAPDGRKAVYALSQIGIGAESSIRTVMMLVDLTTMTQEQVTEPLNAYLNPVRWTEDNTAVLFTLPDRNGTWKFDLGSGAVERVAAASYLGLLGN